MARLTEHLDDVTPLLRGKRVGLLLDLDGTLSELAPDPQDSVVGPEVRKALVALRSKLDLLAVITGRSVIQARKIVDVDDVAYVGNHGLERWERGELVVAPEVRAYLPSLAQLLMRLQSKLSIRGLYFEDKGSSLAVHYRNTADPEASGRRVLEALDELGGQEVKLISGKLVINILPPVELSKGTAVDTLTREHSLDTVIYIGDDVTDLDAFRAIDGLSERGGCIGLKVAVAGAGDPSEVASEADYILESVGEVGWFLNWLATADC